MASLRASDIAQTRDGIVTVTAAGYRGSGRQSNPVTVTSPKGGEYTLDHAGVVQATGDVNEGLVSVTFSGHALCLKGGLVNDDVASC